MKFCLNGLKHMHESPKAVNRDTEGVEGFSPSQQGGVGEIFLKFMCELVHFGAQIIVETYRTDPY